MLSCRCSKGNIAAAQAGFGSLIPFLLTEPQLPAETEGRPQSCCWGKGCLAPSMQNPFHTYIALGRSHLHPFSPVSLHSAFTDKVSGMFFSRLKKNSQDKKTPGCCLFQSVDKLTTEMQTAGTSKALGNQQLQKMLHFLQSLERRGEAGRGQFGTGKASRARETEEHSF